MPLHVSSTCAHHQEVKIALHSLWYHYTSRCDDTRSCVIQFWPPDDEHMCSKHVEAWNKRIVKQKFCASSLLITEINILRCTVSKTSKRQQAFLPKQEMWLWNECSEVKNKRRITAIAWPLWDNGGRKYLKAILQMFSETDIGHSEAVLASNIFETNARSAAFFLRSSDIHLCFSITSYTNRHWGKKVIWKKPCNG